MHRSWKHLLVLVGSLVVCLLILSTPRIIIQTKDDIQLSPILSRSQTAQVGGGSTTYYVSTSGSDSNPGTIDAPWQTLDRAFDNSQANYLQGGDTLYLRGGIYRSTKSDLAADDAVSGSSGEPTHISGYPGEKASIYLSARVDSGWQKYPDGGGASIWYINWVSINKSVPQLVNIDGNPPTVLQQVNSDKSANPGESESGTKLLTSLRTNQDDMIAGDFYYESDNTSKNYGNLYVALPDGSSPNGQPIEVGLDQYFLGSEHDLIVSNLSIRYGNYGPTMQGSNNTIDSIESSYNGFTGLRGTCSNCIVRNSVMSHNGDNGATMTGTDVLYENNTFEANNYRRYTSNYACGGMKIILANQGMIVRGNTFKNSIACPDLWFDNVPNGLTIENNKFHNDDPTAAEGLMIEISDGSADNPILVRNNVFENDTLYVSASDFVYIYNNDFNNGGVTLHGLGGTRYSVSNNRILNNIFYNFWLPIYIAYNPPAPYKSDNNISDYNIIFGPSMVFGNVGGDLDWNNGITYTEWQARGFDAHSIVADPLFTNAGTGDYTLQANSPALGAGIQNDYVTTDIRGISRNGVNDIGAYQISTAPAQTPPVTSLPPTSSPVAPSPVSTPIPTPTYSSSGGSTAQNRIANLLSMGQYSLAQQVAEQYGIVISQNLAPSETLIRASANPSTSVISALQTNFGGLSVADTSNSGSQEYLRPPLVQEQITRNLTLNDQGEDVRLLQRVLNNLGYTITLSGAGSLGDETSVFGASTAKSLMNYQKDKQQYGLIPSGKLDNATLVLINADIKRVLIDPQSPNLVLNTESSSTLSQQNATWYQKLVSSMVSYFAKVSP